MTYWDDENEEWVRTPAQHPRPQSRPRQFPPPTQSGPPPRSEPPTVGSQAAAKTEPSGPSKPSGLSALSGLSESAEHSASSGHFAPSGSSGRKTALTAAAAVVAVLAGAGAAALAVVLLSGGGNDAANTAADAATRADSVNESPGATHKGTTPPSGPDTPDALNDVGPPGFVLRSDPDGFETLTPTDWVRWTKKNSVYYGTKDKSSAIQVFPLKEATPRESLERAAELAARNTGYRRIALMLNDPSGADAVVHEYMYTSEKFGERYLIDRRFTAQKGTLYAVLAVGPVADQKELIEIHGRATWSFAESEG